MNGHNNTTTHNSCSVKIVISYPTHASNHPRVPAVATLDVELAAGQDRRMSSPASSSHLDSCDNIACHDPGGDSGWEGYLPGVNNI